MPHAATSQFFEGLRTSRLLDDDRLEELEARPEAIWGDVVSLANYAQDRGWLTAYQTSELRDGRGHRLAIGGYRIFDKLDEGPAGTTFKALHPALANPVSLRVLRSDWLAPADTAADYLTRVQTACLAQSPHLAGVLDAGTYDNAPFVVQEYVDGCDLYRLVNEMGALPIGLACEYTRQAALAIKAAHEKGISHGDVSPLTLLLSPVKRATGSNGDASIRPRPGATIKLAELGLTPRRPPLGELTFGETNRLGSVAFQPPERLTAGGAELAGDLYGLGATLFFLLTTRPPVAGETPLECMLNLQQAERPAVETLRSDISPAVAELTHQLLDRDPAGRPSAADVAETLLPYCEPSAVPGATSLSEPVFLASETATQPNIPTAEPVSPSAAQPFADPVVELMPEIHPLDEHHDADHHNPFGNSGMGTDGPAITRSRARPTKKNYVWIIAGLILHLTAVIILIGYLTNWFAFARTSERDNTVEEKKDAPIKPKKGKRS
jgi:eukaryotic-like serine/threonine-protein kinase